MGKRLPLFFIILSLFILSISVVSAETATYNSTYEAPLCTSGNYTSTSPCTSASLLNSYYTAESNYYNSVDECRDSNGGFGTTYDNDQIVAWDTDNDGVLETGDTIQVQFDGSCDEGENLYLALAYSLNPEDGDSATWTLIDEVAYDPDDVCGFGSFDETNTNGGFSIRTFTITGTPDYVAVRLLNGADLSSPPSLSNGCWLHPVDVDDLILAMSVPLADDGDSCSVDADCSNDNCRTEIDGVGLYCAGATKECSNAGAVGYDTGESEGNYICIGEDDVELGDVYCETVLSNTYYWDSGWSSGSADDCFTKPTYAFVSADDITAHSVNLTADFDLEDYSWVDAYFEFDGTNYSKTNYTSNDEHYQEISSLECETEYDYTFHLDYTYGTVSSPEYSFNTSTCIAPTISITSAINITNEDARLVGSFAYEDFENVTTYWVVDSTPYIGDVYNKGATSSETDYYNLTSLNYETTYDYYLQLKYINGTTTTGSEADAFTQLYVCSGTQIHSYGAVPVYGGDVPDSLERCAVACEISNDVSCCSWKNAYCYGYNGSTVYDGGGSYYAANVTNSVTTNSYAIVNSTTKNFTTLRDIPYITISNAIQLGGETATLTGTYYEEDYNSTVPFFYLDGVILNPRYNYTNSSPRTETYDLTNLTQNTTYNYTFCVGYGLGWALRVCDTQKQFTTGFIPTISIGGETHIDDTNATLHFTVDYNGATNVLWSLFYGGTNVTSPTLSTDGANSYHWSNLTEATTYPYYIQLNYTTLGNTFLLNSSSDSFTTASENEFDDVWDTLVEGNSKAMILLGVVVVLMILFGSVLVFGKFNMELGTFGILAIVVIGTIIATVTHLFPVYILLAVIIGSVVLAVMKQMFFGGEK